MIRVESLKDEEFELGVGLLIHRLIDFKHHLRGILNCYKVDEIEQLREKIEHREVGSHPAYEDYLDALAYKMEIEEILKNLDIYIQEAREAI